MELFAAGRVPVAPPRSFPSLWRLHARDKGLRLRVGTRPERASWALDRSAAPPPRLGPVPCLGVGDRRLEHGRPRAGRRGARDVHHDRREGRGSPRSPPEDYRPPGAGPRDAYRRRIRIRPFLTMLRSARSSSHVRTIQRFRILAHSWRRRPSPNSSCRPGLRAGRLTFHIRTLADPETVRPRHERGSYIIRIRA